MNEKQTEQYKEIIFEIKRIFSEVNMLPKDTKNVGTSQNAENKLLMIEKSEELLQLYQRKWQLKRKRYDEKLFCKTLSYILKHRDNPLFIRKLEQAYQKR